MTDSLEKTYRLCMASFADSAEGLRWKRHLGRDYDLIAEVLLLNLSRDLALLPDELHGDHVTHLLEVLLPARLPDALACVGRVPEFLLTWLGHLGREHGLARDWEWRNAVEQGRTGYQTAMADPERSRLAPPPGKPHVRPGAKLGRNDPCPCGSGKKYKKCCARL